MKSNTKKTKKIFLILTTALLSLGIGWYVYAATVGQTFDSYEVAEVVVEYALIKGGALKLGEPTYTGIMEDTCNAVPGWYWYTTNGREACWSKRLANNVPWNNGVLGTDDSDNPGEYTCAQDVESLTERMEAASVGEWYKIVNSVADVPITSADNGSSGYSKISALAISDCLDRVRDLCTGNGCLGANVAAINVSLKTWASATGDKSALPYCTESTCGSSASSDYRSACEQNSSNDLPLNCFKGSFYTNNKFCSDTDNHWSWVAVADTATRVRQLGYSSICSSVGTEGTSGTYKTGFRVVVRP